jgi:hypothetical protein
MPNKNYVCPACYADGIQELAQVDVATDVTSFDDNLEPNAFGESYVSWEDYKVKPLRLCCVECGFEFKKPLVMTDEELDAILEPKPVEELLEEVKAIELDNLTELLGPPTDEER